MYLYETHLHTSPVSACAKASPEEQVRAYKNRGYAGIIVTDHFLNGNTTCPRELPWEERIRYYVSGYEAAKTEGDLLGLDVFFGWEYRCSDGREFLTYGLDLEFLLANPGLDTLNIDNYCAVVRKNGGYLAQAHPFRADLWIANQSAVNPGFIDGIEVFNASIPDNANNEARDFALRHGLPMQAGSDSHTAVLPFASGIRLLRRAESIYDIITAIKSSSVDLIVPQTKRQRRRDSRKSLRKT